MNPALRASLIGLACIVAMVPSASAHPTGCFYEDDAGNVICIAEVDPPRICAGYVDPWGPDQFCVLTIRQNDVCIMEGAPQETCLP